MKIYRFAVLAAGVVSLLQAGCASFTNAQPAKLKEASGKTLAFAATITRDASDSVRAANLVATQINGTVAADEIAAMKQIVCFKPMSFLSSSIGRLDGVVENLDEIATPPKPGFAGIASSVKRSGEVVKKMAEVKPLKDRIAEQKAKAQVEFDDCADQVSVDLVSTVADFTYPAPPVGGRRLLGGPFVELNFLAETYKFLLQIGSIYEENKRMEAVRAYAAAYKGDVACALQRLDDAATLPWRGADPCADKAVELKRERYAKGMVPKETRLSSAVSIERIYLLRRALLSYRESQDGTAAAVRRVDAAERTIKYANAYRTTAAIDINGEVLPDLRKWFHDSFLAIERGPQTTAELIDSLAGAIDTLLALDKGYKDWDDARGKR